MYVIYTHTHASIHVLDMQVLNYLSSLHLKC